jgi:predicted nuclease of predicted toxin-antitoxin system
MKVLIDECAPKALKQALAPHGHHCVTAQEAGWSGKVNSELLELAEAEFEVLVTVDTNIEYQQNLTGRKIAIVILRARSNRLTHLSPHFPACVEALQSIKPGEIIYVGEAG